MSTSEIAKGLTALCQQGKNDEAIAAYYAPDILAYEAMPNTPPVRGLDGAYANAAWWKANMEEHGREITGPFLNGDQFAVRFTYDVTDKPTGKRSIVDEIGLYTVQNGKITEARFMYGPSPTQDCEPNGE